MSGERWVVRDEWVCDGCCVISGARWGVCDERCEMSAVRWVLWDEWCEWMVWDERVCDECCGRRVVCDECCVISGVSGVMSGVRWVVWDARVVWYERLCDDGCETGGCVMRAVWWMVWDEWCEVSGYAPSDDNLRSSSFRRLRLPRLPQNSELRPKPSPSGGSSYCASKGRQSAQHLLHKALATAPTTASRAPSGNNLATAPTTASRAPSGNNRYNLRKIL